MVLKVFPLLPESHPSIWEYLILNIIDYIHYIHVSCTWRCWIR